MNRNAINNDDYSDGSDNEQMKTAFPTKGGKIMMPAEKKPFRFMMCIEIQTGFKIIGALEVLTTIFQCFNIFWSVKVGIACLILFNIPLLGFWGMSQYSKSKDQVEQAYKFNTLFLYLYQVRLILLIVGGFIFNLYAANDDSISNFFCDRYYNENYMNAGTVTKELTESLTLCRDSFRMYIWIAWIPTVLFQIHCLVTLYEYRSAFENKEYVKATDDEEDM